MEKTETLGAFYKDKFDQKLENLPADILQFNILNFKDCIADATLVYRRREFYKVTFLKGRYLLHYSDKSLEVNGCALVFFNPDVPYTIETLEESIIGGYFIFKESYFNDYYRGDINDFPMFTIGGDPVYILNQIQENAVDKLFDKMQLELNSNYEFKHDLIRNYILELIHFALKLQPSATLHQPADAKVRLTAVFNELLDRQFPIETINDLFELRSARDFAEHLGVHINYLNRAVRATTGKTTTAHIFERIAKEAIALLKHTNWNISEISYTLGFEDPSHFNHFFKKQTNQVPSSFRP